MSEPTREEAMGEFRDCLLSEFLEAGGILENFENHFEEYMDGDVRVGEE